jgi:hypothetical protein
MGKGAERGSAEIAVDRLKVALIRDRSDLTGSGVVAEASQIERPLSIKKARIIIAAAFVAIVTTVVGFYHDKIQPKQASLSGTGSNDREPVEVVPQPERPSDKVLFSSHAPLVAKEVSQPAVVKPEPKTIYLSRVTVESAVSAFVYRTPEIEHNWVNPENGVDLKLVMQDTEDNFRRINAKRGIVGLTQEQIDHLKRLARTTDVYDYIRGGCLGNYLILTGNNLS